MDAAATAPGHPSRRADARGLRETLRRGVAAFALLLGLLLAPPAGADEPPGSPWARWGSVDFEHLTVRQGLPHATTTAFAQGRDGLMWIGTFGGLVRYDGYRTQVFRQSAEPGAGPPDNYIRALQAAPDGSVIVGTSSGGLARFDPRGNRFERYDSSPRGTGTRVMALAPDHAGGFWIAGKNGLSHLAADLRTIERPADGAGLPQQDDADTFAVLDDRDGNLWVGSNRGLYVRRHGAARFRRVQSDDAAARAVLDGDIWAIRQDRAGDLWVGSGSAGIVLIDTKGRIRVPAGLAGGDPAIQHRTVRDILELRDGHVWIATDGIGIAVYDPARGTAAAPLQHDKARAGSLGGNIVRALFLDRSDGLWAATEADASRSDTRPPIVYTLDGAAIFGPDSAGIDENVRSVYTDRRGTVWLGFNRGRIAAIDPARGAIRTLLLGGAQQDQDVRAIDALDDGRIVAGSRGLVTIDPDTLQVKPYPVEGAGDRPILALRPYRGELLVGTYDGLLRATPDGKARFYQHKADDPRSLADNQVRNIAVLPDGNAWIATTGGISILHPDRDGFDNLVHAAGDPASLPQNYTGSIVAAAGRAWVGTYGGLASTPLSPGAGGYRFETVRSGDGFDNENIASILVGGDGRLWITTSNGLAIYDPSTRAIVAVGERDGLESRFYNQRAASLGPAGDLLFGGLGGLTVIEPAQAERRRQQSAALAVTQVTLNMRRIPFAQLPRADRPLQVGRGVRSLRFAFSLLDYTAPGSVRYSYKLDGFDEMWMGVDPGLPPGAKYTNLPGGHYRLLLRAAIPGLHARTVETAIPLDIELHWYERDWARVALALLALAAVYLLVLLRTRYLRRRARRLARLVRERTAELQRANEQLKRLASTDELTGLLNRRALMQRLEQEHDRAVRLGTPLSLLMLDLDAFKALNDRHGHQAGDAVLRAVASIVTSHCRNADHLGRYGGEELLLVLPGSGLDEAQAIAERIRAAIAAATVPYDNALLQLTASIGVAALRAGERTPSLIARADAALYRAKNAGRNAVQAATA